MTDAQTHFWPWSQKPGLFTELTSLLGLGQQIDHHGIKPNLQKNL